MLCKVISLSMSLVCIFFIFSCRFGLTVLFLPVKARNQTMDRFYLKYKFVSRRTQKDSVKLSKLRQTGQAVFAASSYSNWLIRNLICWPGSKLTVHLAPQPSPTPMHLF